MMANGSVQSRGMLNVIRAPLDFQNHTEEECKRKTNIDLQVACSEKKPALYYRILSHLPTISQSMMEDVKAATVTSMFRGDRTCAACASPDDLSLVTSTVSCNSAGDGRATRKP